MQYCSKVKFKLETTVKKIHCELASDLDINSILNKWDAANKIVSVRHITDYF